MIIFKEIVLRQSGVPEHVRYEVVAQGNLANIVVTDETYRRGLLSNLRRHAFIFPDWFVNIGDQVLLFTSDRTPETFKQPDGTAHHYFYWGGDGPVWNNSGDTVRTIIPQIAFENSRQVYPEMNRIFGLGGPKDTGFIPNQGVGLIAGVRRRGLLEP